mmetsp:Transcript_18851/g.47942  ORF Transcript_18851/g.47942 Transcript_18851/m.47942 type:complete len:354 (+) Transcript_18851:115-1176(+)
MFECGEMWFEGRVASTEGDVSTFVAETITIVRGTEHRDTLPIVCHLVALVLHLMASDQQTQLVLFQEAFGHIWTKTNADTTFAGRTTGHRLWIGPEKFSHQSLIRRLAETINCSDLTQFDTILTEDTTMNNQDLGLNEMTERQALEHFGEEICSRSSILGFDFTKETIDAIHIDRFVIASREEHTVGEDTLQSEQRDDNLGAKTSAIDKITVEQHRVCFAGQASFLKNVQEIIVLTVCITTNCDSSIFWDSDIDQWPLRTKVCFCCSQNFVEILDVYLLLSSKSLHHLLHLDQGQRKLKNQTLVVTFDDHLIDVQSLRHRRLWFTSNGLLESNSTCFLLTLSVSQTCISITRS